MGYCCFPCAEPAIFIATKYFAVIPWRPMRNNAELLSRSYAIRPFSAEMFTLARQVVNEYRRWCT